MALHECLHKNELSSPSASGGCAYETARRLHHCAETRGARTNSLPHLNQKRQFCSLLREERKKQIGPIPKSVKKSIASEGPYKSAESRGLENIAETDNISGVSGRTAVWRFGRKSPPLVGFSAAHYEPENSFRGCVGGGRGTGFQHSPRGPALSGALREVKRSGFLGLPGRPMFVTERTSAFHYRMSQKGQEPTILR